VIQLDNVRKLLDRADVLVTELDGQPLDERSHGDEQKTQRIARSRHLQELANHLELAASLVRHEYWIARGAADPLSLHTRKQ